MGSTVSRWSRRCTAQLVLLRVPVQERQDQGVVRQTYARRQLRATFRSFLALNRWPLLLLVALLAGCAGITRLLGGSAYQQGLVDGLIFMLAVSGTAFLFFMHTEGLQQLGGAWGEERTAEILATALKRGDIWGSVHNIDMGGYDIDHVAFTPGGVLALESKWKFRQLGRGRWLNNDLHQAVRNAEKARSVLRSRDIGTVYDVTSVLVVWGKGAHEIVDGGETADGVHLVAGADLQKWLEQFSVGRLAQDHAERDLAALRAFVKKRQAAVSGPK
jgi:hypothetical protein